MCMETAILSSGGARWMCFLLPKGWNQHRFPSCCSPASHHLWLGAYRLLKFFDGLFPHAPLASVQWHHPHKHFHGTYKDGYFYIIWIKTKAPAKDPLERLLKSGPEACLPYTAALARKSFDTTHTESEERTTPGSFWMDKERKEGGLVPIVTAWLTFTSLNLSPAQSLEFLCSLLSTTPETNTHSSAVFLPLTLYSFIWSKLFSSSPPYASLATPKNWVVFVFWSKSLYPYETGHVWNLHNESTLYEVHQNHLRSILPLLASAVTGPGNLIKTHSTGN